MQIAVNITPGELAVLDRYAKSHSLTRSQALKSYFLKANEDAIEMEQIRKSIKNYERTGRSKSTEELMRKYGIR